MNVLHAGTFDGATARDDFSLDEVDATVAGETKIHATGIVFIDGGAFDELHA